MLTVDKVVGFATVVVVATGGAIVSLVLLCEITVPYFFVTDMPIEETKDTYTHTHMNKKKIFFEQYNIVINCLFCFHTFHTSVDNSCWFYFCFVFDMLAAHIS